MRALLILLLFLPDFYNRLITFYITLDKFHGLNRKYYKCLTAKHPTSNVAIFIKHTNGSLTFEGVKQDKLGKTPSNSPDLFKAYQTSGPGDSGSPWSTKINLYDDEMKRHENRHGIHTSGRQHSCKGLKKMSKCLQTTTKVTEEIVEWIKKLSQ